MESLTPNPTVEGWVSGTLKSRFWKGLAREENYLRALGMAEVAVRRSWLWNDKKILHRLDSLARLAFWNGDLWKDDAKIEARRREFFGALQRLCGPRLKGIADWGEKRRLNRFLSEIESLLEIPDPYCRPRECLIEFTDNCNLRCSMCPQSFQEWERSYTDENVLDMARSLYPYLEVLDYTSFGESLLSPLFWKALDEAPAGVETMLLSNGHRIDESTAERLVRGRLAKLQISLDAVSSDTYRRVRGVDGFDKVIANAKALVAAKQSVPSSPTRLSFRCTMRRSNLDELVPLIRLASAIGFQGVDAHFLIVLKPELREDSLYREMDRVRTVLAEADRVAREVGIHFGRPRIPGLEGGDRESEGYCPEPWKMIYLRTNGAVSCCSNSAENFYPRPGETLEDLWDSARYRQLRSVVNRKGTEAPPICRTCRSGRCIPVDEPRYHFVDADGAQKVLTAPTDGGGMIE